MGQPQQMGPPQQMGLQPMGQQANGQVWMPPPQLAENFRCPPGINDHPEKIFLDLITGVYKIERL